MQQYFQTAESYIDLNSMLDSARSWLSGYHLEIFLIYLAFLNQLSVKTT